MPKITKYKCNSEQEPLPVQSVSLIENSKDRCLIRTKKLSNFIPKRFIFSFIGFLASTLAVTLNTNLSLAIVSMVDRSNETFTEVKSSNECLSNKEFTLHLRDDQITSNQGEFHWNPETEGLLLGSLYYGQMFGFLPGGRMAEVFGGKKTIIGFILLASLSTFICPLFARLSVYAFAVSRFFIGIGTAPIVPVYFHLISRWIPDSERSLSVSFILAGFGFGAFVSFLSAGALCASNLFGGWPSVFYFGGICGFCWCFLCYILIYEKPIDHPSITEQELNYILENLGPAKQTQIQTIPWKSILSSKPFWALAIGYFGQFWILGFYCTTQALYMGTILHLNTKMNGVLSCIPHLARGLFACICGYPADWALRRGTVSKSFVRKGATFLNSVFACCGFVAVILSGCSATLATVSFTFGGLLADFITFGVCMAGVDLAPNLSGTLSGILSFVGVIPFFAIPALVGFSTQYERSMAQWRFVYYVTISIVASTTLIFILFGTSDSQDWGTYGKSNSTKKNKEQTDEWILDKKLTT